MSEYVNLSREDLGGGKALDPNLRSTIEPLYREGVLGRDSDLKEEINGLRIHNPDGSSITVRMDAYHGNDLIDTLKQIKNQVHTSGIVGTPEVFKEASKNGQFASTEDLRNELFETYKRIAATELGTDIFTQNAKYFKEVTWIDPNEAQAKPEVGKFAGNMRDRSPDVQDYVIIRQHDQFHDAEYRKLALEKNLSTSSSSTNPLTLKERIALDVPSNQHDKILALVSQRLNSTYTPSAEQTA